MDEQEPCCPAALTSSKSAHAPSAPHWPSRSTRSTSTRSSTSRPRTLELNEIGVCNINLDRTGALRPLRGEPRHGRFHPDRPAHQRHRRRRPAALRAPPGRQLHWQAIEINRAAHASLKGQRPCVIWFTGLSGAGKSTIANIVERKLHEQGRHTYLLDGDNVRHGLNKDLGFTDADRVENIRRVAEVASLMVDAGLIVLVSFISPFRAERQMARELIRPRRVRRGARRHRRWRWRRRATARASTKRPGGEN